MGLRLGLLNQIHTLIGLAYFHFTWPKLSSQLGFLTCGSSYTEPFQKADCQKSEVKKKKEKRKGDTRHNVPVTSLMLVENTYTTGFGLWVTRFMLPKLCIGVNETNMFSSFLRLLRCAFTSASLRQSFSGGRRVGLPYTPRK